MSIVLGGCGKSDPRLGGALCPTEQDVRLWFIRRGTYIPFDATLAELQSEIKAGNVIGGLTWQEITHEDQEASIIRSSQGTATKRSDGIKGWMASFDTSPCRDNEWSKLDRSREWGVAWENTQGQITGLAKRDDNTWTGFDCYVYTDQYQNLVTSEGYGTTIHVELEVPSNASWKTDKVLVDGEDFDYSGVDAIEGVGFTLSPFPVIGETDITVAVTGQCNDNFVSGLDETKLKVFQDGVELTIASIAEDPSAKTYTLTFNPLIAADYAIEINDGTGKIISLDDSFYSGEIEFKLA
ncbi:hypothetical protein [uncultured Mediterranean phage uvMED]|nr:hypothetical protein [uncultured Mediterranean phage uvMED]